MAYAPAQQVPIVQRIPTRMVPSGTITLQATSGVAVPGVNNRQYRVQLVISNLDGGQVIKLQSSNGTNAATIQPSTSETFETSADCIVYNPGANPVQIEIFELYPDTGNLNAVPQSQMVPGPPGTPGISGGSGSGPAGIGGGTPQGGRGGTSSGGFVIGGGGGLRQGQPP